MIKIYLYTIILFFSIWVLDALDFNRFLKKNKNIKNINKRVLNGKKFVTLQPILCDYV